VRLRGQGAHRFEFTGGTLAMNPPGPYRPDVVISADPEAWLLVVYRRGQSVAEDPHRAAARLGPSALAGSELHQPVPSAL